MQPFDAPMRAHPDGTVKECSRVAPASQGTTGSGQARNLNQALTSRSSRSASTSLSCVIPCRNEAKNLELLLPRLAAALDKLSVQWEIIVVDDGSNDATGEVVRSWLERGVRLLELSRNFGKEAALSAGLDAALGDAVLLMDGDGQHPAELIADMVTRWASGADMVCMVRTDRREESWAKRVGTRLFYGLVDCDRRFRLPVDAGDFRLLDRQVVEALRSLPERRRFMKGLFAWVGFRVEYIGYTPPPRPHGRSHYSLRALCSLSLTGIAMFTTWPLRAASVLGFGLALLAFAYGAIVSLSYLFWGNEVSGWTTIVVAMMLLAGVQLVCLGVIGEYLARVFDEVKGRPLYVIRRSHGLGLQEEWPWDISAERAHAPEAAGAR